MINHFFPSESLILALKSSPMAHPNFFLRKKLSLTLILCSINLGGKPNEKDNTRNL